MERQNNRRRRPARPARSADPKKQVRIGRGGSGRQSGKNLRDSSRMIPGENSRDETEKKGKSSGGRKTDRSGGSRTKGLTQNNRAGRRAAAKGKKRRQGNQKPKETMRIIPLGGMHEIGKNITLIEYKDDILIVDCGFSFPEDEMFGIDVVIPDFTYLKENSEKVRGLIITHGHEDHIGGVPFLLKELDIPVYASPLAMGLIEDKANEHGLSFKKHVIHAGDKFTVGHFRIEAIRTNHSIADSLAYSIKCPAGHIVHTGDFKVDYSPLDGKRIDLSRFASLGDEGVDVLMCDSTNVLRPGYTPSEKIVIDSMNDIFAKTDKRIIIATFSSNIYRIKYFMEASIRYGRKIAISGRSMEKVTRIARDLGYLDLPESAFVDIRKISNIPDGNLTIVTTGSQGEPMSALTRMANDAHKAVKLKSGDTVVFSSSPIPGNEKTITNVVNKLYAKNVNVYLSDIVDIHVSGHACQEELKLIHALVRPRYFIPAHGEYRHLIEHAKLAESMGMNKGSIFVMSNGDALRITGKQAKLEKDAVQADDVLVDGYGVGDVGNVVLRDRKQLSEAGLIVISVAIDSGSDQLAANPELITRGFIYVKENVPLINEATEVVYDTIDRCRENGQMDFNSLKTALKDDMRSFIYKKTKRNPVILPVILYV
jgi:ribonuclease J